MKGNNLKQSFFHLSKKALMRGYMPVSRCVLFKDYLRHFAEKGD